MENKDYYDDEIEVIKPPYYRVMYIDDEGRKHLATVTHLTYLQYLKDRFTVVECTLVTE